MYNIVTIERRYASGGNEIGQKLAEALGYKLYDRNILIKAAKIWKSLTSRLRISTRALPAVS